MKTFYAAVAAALVVTGAGCTTMHNSCGPCGADACRITTSQVAPRAGVLQGRCHDGPGILDCLGWARSGCGDAACGDTCGTDCGCESGLCGDACGAGKTPWLGGLFQRGSRGCCNSGGCDTGCNMGGCGNGGCLQNGLSQLLDCKQCGNRGGGFCGFCGGGDQNYNFQPGPPVGQVAYPYYTVRGPRDFLMANPPSIGPR